MRLSVLGMVAAVLTGISILLSGCGKDPSGDIRAKSEAIVKSATVKDADPAKSYASLRDARVALAKTCNGYEGIYRSHVSGACSEEMESLKAAALDPLQDSLQAGDVGTARVFIAAFAPNATDDLSDEVRAIVAKPDLAANVLATADALKGQATDQAKAYEVLAGILLVSGKGVAVDRARGVDFYQQAWIAGEQIAAAKLANVYAQGRDSVNAYLWSLRCAGSCLVDLSPDAGRSALEQSLDPATLKSIRSKAPDQTVLNL